MHTSVYSDMCMHACVYVDKCAYVYVCMFVCMHLYVCVREMSSSFFFPPYCLKQVSRWTRSSLFGQTSTPASPPRPCVLGLHVCHHTHHPHFHMDAELRSSCQRGQYFAGGAASPALNRLSGYFPLFLIRVKLPNCSFLKMFINF